MAEELGAAMGASSGSSLPIGHPWLLWGGCSHWPYPSRRPGTLLHLPGLQDNSCSHHLPALLGMDNKTHWEFREFSQALPGPVTQVTASALLSCLHWLPALALLGTGVWGLLPGFITSGLSKPHLLLRGWFWGCGTAVGHWGWLPAAKN